MKLINSKKVLSDVPEHYMSFWFNNGRIAKNIYELLSSIKSCTKEVFEYHVNPEKNDFARWAHDILKDDVLSKRLTGELDQKKVVLKIKKRINELKKLK